MWSTTSVCYVIHFVSEKYNARDSGRQLPDRVIMFDQAEPQTFAAPISKEPAINTFMSCQDAAE